MKPDPYPIAWLIIATTPKGTRYIVTDRLTRAQSRKVAKSWRRDYGKTKLSVVRYVAKPK